MMEKVRVTSELCCASLAMKRCCRMYLNVKSWQRQKSLVHTVVAVVSQKEKESLPLHNCYVATFIRLWTQSACSQEKMLSLFVTFVVFIFSTSFKILAFRNKLVNIYKINHTKQQRRLEKCFGTKTMCFTQADSIIQFHIRGEICKYKWWKVPSFMRSYFKYIVEFQIEF